MASDVILQVRKNKKSESFSLGFSFYYFGLFQQMILAISDILDRVKPSTSLSSLYNILGNLYSSSGNLKEAIKCHKASGEIAVKLSLQRLYLFHLFNMGFCKLELWEIEESVIYFEKGLLLSEKMSIFDYYTLSSYCYLCFLKTCLNDKDEARYFIKKFEENFPGIGDNHLNRTYGPFYLGLAYAKLGDFQKAEDIYEIVIKYAKDVGNIHLKAIAFSGMAEIFREKAIRSYENYNLAIQYHLDSIMSLDKIGAKYDLAEAYFQFGLTHQAMGEVEKGLEYRDQAIQLFEEMEAPRQVERVRQAFVSSGDRAHN